MNKFLGQLRKARCGKVLMWDLRGGRWIVWDRDMVRRFSNWCVVIKDFSK